MVPPLPYRAVFPRFQYVLASHDLIPLPASIIAGTHDSPERQPAGGPSAKQGGADLEKYEKRKEAPYNSMGPLQFYGAGIIAIQHERPPIWPIAQNLRMLVLPGTLPHVPPIDL